MNDIESFIRDAAAARGIDPDTAVKVAQSEGGIDEYAKRGTFATGSSWWPFQEHYGGEGYEQFGTVAGMGNDFTALTGWQPGDEAAWKDSVRYALNMAKREGWSKWYGAAHVGVDRWDGIDRDHPWNAGSEVWDFERGANSMPPLRTVTYDKMQPAFSQNDTWSCAPTSARWAITSLGRHPSESWMESQMIQDGIVSPEHGLLDSTGAALADWLEEQYGGFGYQSNNEPAITFDWALNEGHHSYPILLGGRRFGAGGHWVAVRDADLDTGVLLLMNPASGYTGVGQTLSRGQFADRGPWSAVRLWHPDLFGPAPAPAPPTLTLAEVKSELARLQSEIAALADKIPG